MKLIETGASFVNPCGSNRKDSQTLIGMVPVEKWQEAWLSLVHGFLSQECLLTCRTESLSSYGELLKKRRLLSSLNVADCLGCKPVLRLREWFLETFGGWFASTGTKASVAARNNERCFAGRVLKKSYPHLNHSMSCDRTFDAKSGSNHRCTTT